MTVVKNLVLLLGLWTAHTLVSGLLIFARGTFSGFAGEGFLSQASYFLIAALPYGPGAALGGIGAALFIESERRWIWALAFAILVSFSFVTSQFGISWRILTAGQRAGFVASALLLPTIALICFAVSHNRLYKSGRLNSETA